jgi:hypothetical protein
LPQEIRYEQKGKKEVLPNSNSKETHVQYRKLVKSLGIIKEILRQMDETNE